LRLLAFALDGAASGLAAATLGLGPLPALGGGAASGPAAAGLGPLPPLGRGAASGPAAAALGLLGGGATS